MRRLVAFFVPFAALVLAGSAAATLQPVVRKQGDRILPRVRPGTVQVPPGHAAGRVRVIVGLASPPLAAAARDATGADRLDTGSSFSRSYLARLTAEQSSAAAALRRAVPGVRIGRSFKIVLNGLTVELPYRQLPALARQPVAARVYPSARYTLHLNKSLAIIGADVLQAATGAKGDGVKIAVVDDGVDHTNPFFNPANFSYPAGFPKGQTAYTSPKVIAARAFPGPGSGAGGQLPLDRRASFHGTHVAGIAAGDAGTNAPAGRDHPATAGLSGVAPRAWIGSYRVFNAPTPVGNSAFTPEIVAAFEAAVADGMDVINFSGGGPQNEPESDALVQAIPNIVKAGVVVVISAGNDRAEFGLGSIGTPGTAPDAITVAAVSNTHVFAQPLTVDQPANANLGPVPLQPSLTAIPPSWESSPQPIVDIRTLKRANGQPLEEHACAPGGDPNANRTMIPRGSLTGVIALVARGTCSFLSKAERVRAAGATGVIFIDNRPGETTFVPVELPLPGGMISDLDGARLRAAMAGNGGRAQIRVGFQVATLDTGRSGIPAYFSSAGPTSFRHDLKPDIAAPGAQILSSTLPELVGSPFAVFDGTSMAAPHIAGSAALLVQLHPSWTPAQVKSALMATAVPAYADTARTAEAPVLLEGAGLAQLPRANDPKIFTAPQSLSLHELNIRGGAQTRSTLVSLSDAGGGEGTWGISVQPQSATRGVGINVPPSVSLAPGGTASLPVTAVAAADAQPGDQFGFVVLARGGDVRRIPYHLLVEKPRLQELKPVVLKATQTGTTARGASHASLYRYPSTPFGPAANFIGAPMNEDGGEKLYVTQLKQKAANIGVAVIAQSTGAVIDPFFLGSQNENDVQGYGGTPVNVNAYMFDYRVDVGAAGAQFPRQKQFFVSVDSGHDHFTNKKQHGDYLLRFWVNDVAPPRATLLTTRVAAGRPMLAVRFLDAKSGVDPYSLAIAYNRVLVGAALYDPFTGLALFPLPNAAPKIALGNTAAILVGSDYQETKNVDQAGGTTQIMPNTTFKNARITAVSGPTLTWLGPAAQACAAPTERLLVLASSTRAINRVRFLDGSRLIKVLRKGVLGLYGVDWKTAKLKRGRHVLRAVAVDAAGRSVEERRAVRVCGKS